MRKVTETNLPSHFTSSRTLTAVTHLAPPNMPRLNPANHRRGTPRHSSMSVSLPHPATRQTAKQPKRPLPARKEKKNPFLGSCKTPECSNIRPRCNVPHKSLTFT